MTKHTSGPWFAGRAHFGLSGDYTPLVRAGDTARVLCLMNLSGAYNGYAGKEQAEADARLMAASPDMLPALRKAESFIAGFEGDELQEGIDEMLSEIRAAIAKAEGQGNG